jgi:hypothetical protein
VTERDAIKAMFSTDNGTPLKMQEHKLQLTLVPKEAIECLAKVYEYGLHKYERDSWRKFTPEQAKNCLPDSALRHLLEYCNGQETDSDSGLPHLVQAAWNCLTLHIITTQ